MWKVSQSRWLVLFTLASVLPLKAGQVEINLTSESPEIVLGQPLIVTLVVKNDSETPLLVVPTDPELTHLIVSDSEGKVLKPRPLPAVLDAMYFGIQIDPGKSGRSLIAVTDLSEASAPGEYLVSLSIPAAGLSASIRVSVAPNDPQALEAWMEKVTQTIISESDFELRLESTKALASVVGNVSEPYDCRVVNEAQAVAIPTVTALEKMGTTDAATCLLDALPKYSGIEREFLKSSLTRMKDATSNPGLRMEIDAAVQPSDR